MTAIVDDLRDAWTQLQRRRALTLATVGIAAATLAIATATLGLVDALLLRNLRVPAPQTLVAISARASGQLRPVPITLVSELRDAGIPLDHLCAYSGGATLALEAGGNAAPVNVVSVSGDCFDAFGVALALGRPIGAADAPLFGRGQPVAVISHRLWGRAFGFDAGVVGRSVRAEGVDVTVIGVLPATFAGLLADTGVDLLAPFDTLNPARPNRRPLTNYVVGRLRPGTTMATLQQHVSTVWPAAIAAAMPTAPTQNERDVWSSSRPQVVPLGRGISFLREQYGSAAALTAVLSALLVVLGGVHSSGLLLAHLLERGNELAMRRALGASYGRIVRVVVLETVMRVGAGAALGLVLAVWVAAAVDALIPRSGIERIMTLTPQWPVMTLVIVLSLVAAVPMATIPCLLALRKSPTPVSTARLAGGRARQSRRLVAIQVALTLVLVSGAGLLTVSLFRLRYQDLGVRQAGVWLVRTAPLPNAFRALNPGDYYQAVLAAVRDLPTVVSAGHSRVFPRMVAEAPLEPVAIAGEPLGAARGALEVASPGYFETLDLTVVRGRSFTAEDSATARPVAVVNARLASVLAPAGDVVGRLVRFGVDLGLEDAEIVGVVADTTLGNLRQPVVPIYYRPTAQAGRLALGSSLLIESSAPAADVAARVTAVLNAHAKEYVTEVVALTEMFDRSAARERVGAHVSAVVGTLALALGCLGLYCLLDHAVVRRRRELAVRLAVGATPRHLFTAVVREAIAVTSLGLLIGAPLAWAAMRALGASLHAASPRDALIPAAAALVILVAAVAASVRPALRAGRVDPATDLRD